MYKTIVAAYDGSEASAGALKQAARRIRERGGKLIIVNAVFFDEEEFGIAPEQREKRLESGKRLCLQTRDSVRNQYGIEVESFVCEGDAQDVVVDIAREKQADLITMGTHGRKGLKRILMGSVTSGVIVNSPVDVLVAKNGAGDERGRFRSVLVAFDGSDFSRKALERACTLSKKEGAEITVLYVIPRYEEMIGFIRTDSIRESLSEGAAKIIDSAEGLASSRGAEIKKMVREGQGAEEIANCAAELHSDVIIIGTYGWRGVNRAIMGSATERVIMNAGCPVLAVK